jgi:anti-sigma regulatory factor (Ser/Thr protein kinase)
MAGPGVRRESAADDWEDGGGEAEAAAALPEMITLPGEERAVATGRRFVRDVLGRRHPALDKVVLGVSELATNAIKHTSSGDGGQIMIRLAAVGQGVRAEVTNDGSTPPPRRRVRPDADAEDGRGLVILEALADACGVTEQAGRITVWAEFWAGGWSRPRTGVSGSQRAVGG